MSDQPVSSSDILVQQESSQKPPKIEFPCESYPVKVMGESSDEYITFVLETTERFSPNFDRSKVAYKESGKGRFTSVTVFITATGADHLEAYHRALRLNNATKIVL